MTKVKFTGWYKISSFVNKEGQTVAKATRVDNNQECDDSHATFLYKGDEFEGVISYPHPTENDLRGDSAAPLEGYNIFGTRVYNNHPRHRRNRG